LPALETRDKYFTEVKEEIEKLYKNTGLPVVVVCHSMGNRFVSHDLR
jgi:esterase/lipase superfamily enzyme